MCGMGEHGGGGGRQGGKSMRVGHRTQSPCAGTGQADAALTGSGSQDFGVYSALGGGRGKSLPHETCLTSASAQAPQLGHLEWGVCPLHGPAQVRALGGCEEAGPAEGLRGALGGWGGCSDLIVLLTAQTKGQLELDVILGAAGRGLGERECDGVGQEREAGERGREGHTDTAETDSQGGTDPES